ncbi:LexA family transcriptional regulator [Aurantiacibacter gangjinensis]|uniref:Transcriptional regulator n=1 Tax=Aurantiacibacter gangjinensis TaxID=502682 RepID=A0A0G9MR71_9SPHN|nr:LexA family transcriptional regulator [Aurantiacibacter gangjinensis]APE29112.1 Peptidase [Aurantiacibacter gangjinensis]KLE33195.1 transcriptional regulator [Aurantiacibacter gangjinensis]
MDARETLVEAAKARGSSLAALSRMIGRNGTYLQQYITKGSPKKLEEEDRRVLAQFLGVDERDLGAPKDNSYDSRGRNAAWVDVPRLDIDASAGPGAVNAEEVPFDAFRFSRKWLAEQGLDGSQLSAIRVVGDSMEPLLREGDEVLVDRREQPFRDGVHVVRLDDSLLVKRVASKGNGRFSLLSQNLAYPPIEVGAEEFAIIGRVVWKSGRV